VILYRLIDDRFSKWWEDHFKTAGQIPAQRDLPIWAIAPFQLTADELKSKGGLSVFAASEKSELEKVAAAFGLRQNVGTTFFVGAALAKIEKAGIEVVATSGATRVPSVDQKHFEIKANNVSLVSKLARLYLAGEFEKIQKRRAEEVRNIVARNGEIEFIRLANDNNNMGKDRLNGFVGLQHVLVKGADQQ
jgi:hypothetical protein